MTVLERFKLRISDEEQPIEDALLIDLLETAKYAILERRHPYGEFPQEPVIDDFGNITTYVDILEPRYHDLQLRIAIEIYNRMGAEGQLSHRETSVSREYASGFITPQMLRSISPLVGVV